jgi:hypothetical protein
MLSQVAVTSLLQRVQCSVLTTYVILYSETDNPKFSISSTVTPPSFPVVRVTLDFTAAAVTALVLTGDGDACGPVAFS